MIGPLNILKTEATGLAIVAEKRQACKGLLASKDEMRGRWEDSADREIRTSRR